jgi:hypothetical protein
MPRLACIIYCLFTKGRAWVDRGAEQFEENRQARDLAKLQTQASSRGFRLVPAPLLERLGLREESA